LLLGFENAFEFGQSGKVFFTPCGALRRNQTGEVQGTDTAVKNAYRDRLIVDLAPAAETGDHAFDVCRDPRVENIEVERDTGTPVQGCRDASDYGELHLRVTQLAGPS
jgi:hypothetical protein